MAIRFAAFERYKAWLTPEVGKASSPAIFLGMVRFYGLWKGAD